MEMSYLNLKFMCIIYVKNFRNNRLSMYMYVFFKSKLICYIKILYFVFLVLKRFINNLIII